ncbi:hypothetical protein RND81_05G020800 [Saponaria officinalis]|uniref:Uncharacterized protein n=1 Tax=Saponaria officinalis TaxID=3572 RepID=A0AAW1KSJ1_SAPOF
MKKYEQKYLISQKVQVDVNFMKKLMQDLERGKNSTLTLRNIILQHYSSFVKLGDSYNNKNDHLKALDHHSIVSLDSFGNSISMLQSFDFDSSFEKRKLNHHLDHLNVISPNHPCKS